MDIYGELWSFHSQELVATLCDAFLGTKLQIFAIEKAFLNGEFTPCEDTAQPLMSTQKGSYMHLKVVNYFLFSCRIT